MGKYDDNGYVEEEGGWSLGNTLTATRSFFGAGTPVREAESRMTWRKLMGSIPLNVLFAVIMLIKPAMIFRDTGDLVQALNTLAWYWVGYMIISVSQMVLATPWPVIYRPPNGKTEILNQITRENVRRIAFDGNIRPEVKHLLNVFCDKVYQAADEGVISTFLEKKIDQLVGRSSSHYGPARRLAEIIGILGLMGTIVGMMVFLAQAAGFFSFPEYSGDAEVFTNTVLGNLGQINLHTVMTAFITSLIGWGAKAFWGGIIAQLEERQIDSISVLDEWVTDNLIARLHLPSISTTKVQLDRLGKMDNWEQWVVRDLLPKIVERLEQTTGAKFQAVISGLERSTRLLQAGSEQLHDRMRQEVQAAQLAREILDGAFKSADGIKRLGMMLATTGIKMEQRPRDGHIELSFTLTQAERSSS